MNSRISLLALSCLGASALWAVAEEGAASLTTAGYHLKHRSSFTVPNEARPPFWPIGWSPSMKSSPSAPAGVDFALKAEQFNVTSIMLGSTSLAVINGRTYGEGELLRAPRAAKHPDGTPAPPVASALPAGARIRVQKITDGEVTLQAGNQALVVPLHRPKLSEPKATDDDILAQASNDR